MSNIESPMQGPAAPRPDFEPEPGFAISGTSDFIACLASVGMTAVATVVAVGLDNGMTIPNISLIFVLPVIICGLVFGLGSSLLSAVLGALSYNFFLTEPRYSLAVDDPANVWAIALLFLVGLVVSSIAHTSRRRASDAALVRRQTAILHGYSRDILKSTDVDTALVLTSQALASLFQVPSAVMLIDAGKVVSTKTVGGLELQAGELDAAELSLEHGSVTRAGVYPAEASRFDLWPVPSSAGASAIIGVAFDPDKRPASPELLLDIVAGLMAGALRANQARTA